MRLYKFLVSVVVPVFRLFFRVRITGKENMPDGATVVCANHTSMLDPFFAVMLFDKTDLPVFMGKIELFRIPVIGALLRKIEAIPVDRGSTSMSTLRDSINHLKNGRKVVIFPEGTRVSGEADVSGAKTGAAMIACRAGVTMLPVFISGRKRLFGRVDAIVGKEVETDSFEGSGGAKYKAVVEKVFGDILSLGKGGEA
ncbi:MAG: 1-acyl-sn-glycerol-3-phosphate acyltransferase [Oscillospiraceae bacterium]|nr:1-acyl-sn-glycerol-3-phosphate acyltransferase [Oscillospiraceae bacterium]MBQ4316471.1 1-acyl-sn-glycerol-3-phosphate acyltransferase [Oscillospiraceae bacterium]MBQ7054343.1 1-acyl-sn-glycerol-3-phosphate acyltransferase [Oscillospiraceae bacterium]